MKKIAGKTLVALGVMGIVALGAGSASADFEIYAQQDGVNGGAVILLASGADFTSALFDGTYGDFTLTIFGAASSNGAAQSNLLEAALSIRNNSTDSKTLHLYASQTDYTLPAENLLDVSSGLGGTVIEGDLSGTGVFQAYADRNNTLRGLADFTTGAQAVDFDGSSFDTGTASGLFDRIDGSPFSLTSVVTATISGGGAGNFSSSRRRGAAHRRPRTRHAAPARHGAGRRRRLAREALVRAEVRVD